jgi:aminopeptidase N
VSKRFRRILHGITEGRRLQTMTWGEFVDACQAGSRRDLGWFFEQWLHRAGAPDFSFSWEQDGETVRGIIRQPEPF